MSHIVYIGVDDTDVPGSVGTGRVARGLADRLEELGLGTSLGVSRHQLLVDKRIRYTSHNSAKGIALETYLNAGEFVSACVNFLEECFQPGADPGLCVCGGEQVNEENISFGKQAALSVLRKQDAVDLAAKNNIFLKGLGGSGEGIIGALAAVGLRAWGNEGRLVDLPGIHDIEGLISVKDLLRRTTIDSVEDTNGNVLGEAEVIDSLNWVRPSLVRGRAVLRVTPATNATGDKIWVTAEKRNKTGGVGD